jgi:N-methylhydantoinase A
VSYIIGVDIGGTFTDAVAIGERGRVITGKAPTTAHRLGEGLIESVRDAASCLEVTLEELLAQTSVFRFSGTTAINALLTRSGARTGLITTSGFEDTLDVGRGMSAWLGLNQNQIRRAYRQQRPASIVPRSLVRGVHERIDRDGRQVVALDLEEVRAAAADLVKAGVESLAICFLWAVRNPEHERQAKDAVLALYPDLFVCAAHEVASNLGEYERFNTAVINAYIGPRLTASLNELESLLRSNGFAGQLLVGQSDGGALYADETVPVYTMQSGPAGGVIASRSEGQLLEHSNIITADVGGTSFDVGIVADGSWIVWRHPIVDRYSVGFPMIEVESVGAGGGSIAWIDEGGALNVGPQSAGARPGPACYGRGGTLPTVTDAAAVLGYFDPEYFFGGRSPLRLDLARQALQDVASRLDMDVAHAAAGIFEVANAHMATLVFRCVVSHGYDPRDFVLYAYGGGGAMHAAFYAAELSVAEVVVPALAGTFSALGVATAPVLHSARQFDFAQMPISAERFNANLQKLEARVFERLERDHIPESRQAIVYALEMRYGLQVNTVKVPIPRKRYDDTDIQAVNELFDELYERLYGAGSAYTEAGRYVTSFTVEGYGYLPAPERLLQDVGQADATAGRVGFRDAWFGGSYVRTAIYRLDRLTAGNRLRGAAIIEAPHTTIVVPPTHQAYVDGYGNVRLTALNTEAHVASIAREGAVA